jgi:trk system potassium uptake protein TrkH
MGRMTKDVVLYTLVLEGLGAAFLFYRFLADHPPLRALGYAVFHAVSAFCNAGFSTFSNNLENYPADPVVNLTVMGLIVLGGIGFVVMREVWPRLIRPGEVRPRLSLHSRLALWTSFILIFGGAGLLALLEYLSNGGLVWRDSLWPIFFTSITPRTAGFNTIPLSDLSNASLLIIIVLMFIGASPGSTGGGVKTTTAAALTLLVVNRFRGKSWTGVAGRRIPEETLSSSLALVLGTLTLLTLAVVMLLSLGLKASFLGRERGDLLLLLFEAVSAFGTVGLSLDVSPNLSSMGKIVIILLMFIGRVGPLTLVYSLAQQALVAKYQPAEEKIMIG